MSRGVYWSNRPLLCKLGIHRPFICYIARSGVTYCERCSYLWGNSSWIG